MMKRHYLKIKPKTRHVYLPSVGGMATITGKPSPELIKALNDMCAIAYRTVRKPDYITERPYDEDIFD